VCQRFLLAYSVPAAWGEPARPGFPPEGETGKGEIRLPCCRRQFEVVWRPDGRYAADLVCARSSTTFLSIALSQHDARFLHLHSAGYDHQHICRSSRSAFQKSCRPPPIPCRASIRTLNGPRWARCKLGSDLKPRSITTVTDLGCWVLPSTARSLKDRVFGRSHPNKAVEVVPVKTFRYLLACERST
jgi:hypothetical protein